METAAARSVVELVDIPFTGELAVNEHGKWERKIDLDSPQYVGPPSDAIDHAWVDLIRCKFKTKAVTIC